MFQRENRHKIDKRLIATETSVMGLDMSRPEIFASADLPTAKQQLCTIIVKNAKKVRDLDYTIKKPAQ
jgi:hypothetical protein